MKILFKFLLSRAPGLVVLAIVASVLTGAMNTVLLGLINEGAKSLSAIASDEAPWALIWSFCGALIALPLTRVISQVLLVHLSQGSIFDLRMHLASRILAAPLRTLEEKGANKLLAALTDDVTTLSGAFHMIPIFIMHISIALSIYIYLLFLDWAAALGLLAATVIGLSFFILLIKKANGFIELARGENDVLLKHYLALTQGIKELKLHRERRLAYTEEKLSETADANKRYNITGAIWMTIGGSLTHLLFFLVIGFMIFIIPTHWKDGAELLSFALVLFYLLIPLEAIVNTVPLFARAMASLRKIEDLGISLERETIEIKNVAPVKAGWSKLEFRGLTHSYYREADNESFAMGPINLSITPGELVFIVGGNGSGKTTLAKMLVGLYHPDEGEILLDNEAVTHESRDAFRQQFTAVFSDFYLFDSLLGIKTENADERINEYLDKLLLHHKVKIENGELSTIDLSQGQRKRLALLTAYLEDRSIYLFDEWAADQDPHFKDVFYKILLPELQNRGKTILVITHDDHYFHMADRIIKLDNGQIEFDQPWENVSGTLPTHAGT